MLWVVHVVRQKEGAFCVERLAGFPLPSPMSADE